MSSAITTGMLSSLKTQNLSQAGLTWLELGKSLIDIAPQFEIVEMHPEREELLLKSNGAISTLSASIRTILQELQHQTQRPFVALMNPSSQYVLITVRG